MKKIAILLFFPRKYPKQKVIKEIIVKSLSKIVDKTKNTIDNDLLLTIKKAWGLNNYERF